ncbi:bifunctional aspartate transaminase/aspartate 4-decarboxylase [Enterococcus hermanniensis]|uniref:Aminotransferase n=1 Tax=Enterococcus hermanniensis TaxID=249189 RepID=A0A1L8TQ43_9ENTE|nr:bifunctional aspartate transaminase/aspartate 4-decarboxylase [Enterococcus hermanniensis]OJG46242.1 aspartate 4-decarboxylase [Enterococcus hermanniensis]
MDKLQEEKIEKLGAFEIDELLIQAAEKNKNFLNAGKGNPNWINTKARLAFCQLVEFGVIESQRTYNQTDIAGDIATAGIYERFSAFLTTRDDETAEFLLACLAYFKTEFSVPLDDLVAELIDGAIGNNYPTPNRVLKHSEKILATYLKEVLFNGAELANETEIFPTEGGTAAMVYIFQSLKENKLIRPDDKIAISSPIFTPYLQIPELHDYQMVEIDLQSSEENNWEVPVEEFEKLLDPNIKAFFLVNPSNPGSKALGEKELAKIKQIVEKRPDLMIITDEVYGSFVKNFQSVYTAVPHNTLLVYSYSKLFGATGWRLGMIALNQENVFDQAIQNLSENDHQELTERYSLVTLYPDKMKFIDRIVADSRSIGLYHTAGLSTPQQMMMVLFSLTHLICLEKPDRYINESKNIIQSRYELLHDQLNYPMDNSELNSKYYSLIDIYRLADQLYGQEFSVYLKDYFEEIDFLVNLAETTGVVLMDGVGFGTKAGEIRISNANLPTEDYAIIAERILELLKDYHLRFLEAAK